MLIDLPAVLPQFVARESPNPRQKEHSFTVRITVIATLKFLGPHDLVVLIEETASVCRHGCPPPIGLLGGPYSSRVQSEVVSCSWVRTALKSRCTARVQPSTTATARYLPPTFRAVVPAIWIEQTTYR